jgi:predicted peptidase
MTKISILASCLWISFAGFTQDYTAFLKQELHSPEDTLPYRLLLPETVEPGKDYPLIIFLHGSGERGNDNELNLKYITDLFLSAENRKNFPAYVLVPQCAKDKRWAPEDWYGKVSPPAETIVQLIDSLVKTNSIDAERIYLMGLSMGGFGTWYLLTRFPDKFAAAVPICGGGDWNRASTIAHIPVWVFHGKRDEVVLPEQSRAMVKALKKSGGKPRYTEYKKVGHDSWVPALKEPELLQWLFSKKIFVKP